MAAQRKKKKGGGRPDMAECGCGQICCRAAQSGAVSHVWLPRGWVWSVGSKTRPPTVRCGWHGGATVVTAVGEYIIFWKKKRFGPSL